jgi:hypothetical protein
MLGIFSELMRKELDAECWGVKTNTTSVKITSERLFDSTHLRFFTHKSLLKMFQKLGYEVLNIEGLRPTHNRKFRVLNFLLWNRLWDVRYHQFACVVKPADGQRS